MSTETAQPGTMPDAGLEPEAMSLEQIQAELAAYRPGTAVEVIELEAYMAHACAAVAPTRPIGRGAEAGRRGTSMSDRRSRTPHCRRVCGPVPHRCRIAAFACCCPLDRVLNCS
jgi:hypothetical protein